MGGKSAGGWEAGLPRWQEPGEIGIFLLRCVIFCNRKSTKRRELQRKGREPEVRGKGSRKFRPPPPPTIMVKVQYKTNRMYIKSFNIF